MQRNNVPQDFSVSFEDSFEQRRTLSSSEDDVCRSAFLIRRRGLPHHFQQTNHSIQENRDMGQAKLIPAGVSRERRQSNGISLEKKSVVFYDRKIDKVSKECAAEEPPRKRRRFERRNSKTPAMLMAMILPFHESLLSEGSRKTKRDEAFDDFAFSLELAEGLVEQLRKRRISHQF
jgi:hypothetical protein